MADFTPPLSPISPIKGVLFTPPPAELIPSIRASLERSIATLPAGAKGGVFGIATRDAQGQLKVNAAIVTILPKQVVVELWAAKTWGSSVATDYRGDGFEAGVRVLKTW